MRYKFYYIPQFQKRSADIFVDIKMKDIQALWSLIQHTEENLPQMPLELINQKTAYLEDPIHDYNIKDKRLRYASRYSEGHWILLIFDTKCPHCTKSMKVLGEYCPLCGLKIKY